MSEIGGKRERRIFCVHFPHSLFLCDLEPPLTPPPPRGAVTAVALFALVLPLSFFQHTRFSISKISHHFFQKMPHSWSAFPFHALCFLCERSALLDWRGAHYAACSGRLSPTPRGRLHVSARFSGFPGDGAWSPTPRSALWCPSLTLPPSLLPLAGRPSLRTLARTHAAAARNRAKCP